MCSNAWSMDTRSIDSVSCCRGIGGPRRLSRAKGMCNLSTLTVSVRSLHTCPREQWRVISGFFAHWRISEWETDVRGQMHTARTGRGTAAVELEAAGSCQDLRPFAIYLRVSCRQRRSLSGPGPG